MNDQQQKALALVEGRAGLSSVTAEFIRLLIENEPAVCGPKGVSKSHVRKTFADLGWDLYDVRACLREAYESGLLYSDYSGTIVGFYEFPEPVVKRCAYCKCKASKKRPMTKDHVVPSSKGGSSDPSNIVDACHACNNLKADRTPEEWARDILNYRKPFDPKPMTRLPIRYRLRLAVASAVAFVLATFGN